MPNIGLKISGNPGISESVDLILTSTDTNVASIINALGNNASVFLRDTIIVTAAQEITVSGLTFTRNPDAIIEYSGSGNIDYIFKINSDDCNLDLNLEYTGTGTVTSGLVIDGDNNILKEESLIKMNNGSEG
ncbi:unnamed protein product, partial [marine sediment metagenome]